MVESQLQVLCERGQIELMETRYLDAVDTLMQAEQQAWESRSFDTLARLYLPLQEARRQIRQRCGEGDVRLHLIASGPEETINPFQVIQSASMGQLLVAGWNTFEPALHVRQLASQQHLYIETFLASVDETGSIKIIPLADHSDAASCLFLKPQDLPPDVAKGTADTFAYVMALWERLHTPFLKSAERIADPIERMQAYRLTLQVDPACELAHQFLADTARFLAKQR